jgi:hypothetical protein
MRQAIEYFKGLGWVLVGKADQINQHWNGADLVFTTGIGQNMRVLAVELKDVTGQVNLGPLGRSKVYDDYGGSIKRIVRSAARFASSSKEQLRLMSQAVLKGRALGTLENALFTAAKGVSPEATGVSEGQLRMQSKLPPSGQGLARVSPQHGALRGPGGNSL